MNEEQNDNKPWAEAGGFALPKRMPPRPPLPPPTTKVPRVFSIWGTIVYGGAAITAIISLLAMGIFKWIPPWYIIMTSFLYTFVSAGLICLGRIDTNKESKLFIQALKKRSEDNKKKRSLN